LHDPHAQVAEEIDARQIVSEHLRRLKTEDEAETAALLRARKIRVLADDQVPIRV
jgi:hypothetical protein